MCNEGYIFIRGSTCITWDMVFGQTGWYGWMGGLEEWVDGWTRGMGGWLLYTMIVFTGRLCFVGV